MAYYERQCSRDKQEVYGCILRGIRTVDSAIRIPLLSMNDLSEVYTRLRLDHPEIFYFAGFQIRSRSGAEYGELLPEYLFDKDKILAHRKAIDSRVERLLREVKNAAEAEKISFLHDFIISRVRYDKLKKPYSHEVIGPLTQGVGVCEGIAKTVKLLADAMQLECIVAFSAPEEGKRYGHAWNVIRRGGKWYHLDATFDLSLSACGEKRWDYCLLSDAQVYRDHGVPLYPVPESTDSGCFYYREQHLSFTGQEELAKRIVQAAKKKKPHIVFHWRGGCLTGEQVQKLAGLICRSAAEGGRQVQISLNRKQAVFFVRFTDSPPETRELTMETADEGNE